MKELIKHLKKVAIEDTRLFFEPYVAVGRLIRRFVATLFSRPKQSNQKSNGGDSQ